MNLPRLEPLRFEDWVCAVSRRESLQVLHEMTTYPKLGLTFNQWLAYSEWDFRVGTIAIRSSFQSA